MILTLISFLISEFAVASSPVTISFEEVTARVSSQNYVVLENAQKVYQAKESISVARGNLLPRLNLWRWIEPVVQPTSLITSLIGGIEDIAPFLVPSNWFRLSEEKVLYQAQKEAYRSLWANEVMTAKSLFVHALIDESLYQHLTRSEQELNKILQIVKTREVLGGARPGASQEIEVRLLAIQEDKRSLEVIIREDKTALAFMMGLPGNTELNLRAISMPNFRDLSPIEYEVFEFRALDVSPEIKQFGHLVHAADYVRRERTFAFLGMSNIARGLSGNVFDELPAQQGLGFGTGASIRITRAQKEILKLQKKGVEETIRRNLKLLVENYNLDLLSYASMKRRVDLTRSLLDRQYERLGLGDSVEPLELVEASRSAIQAQIAFFAVQYRFLTTEDRLSRLIFHGEYAHMPEPRFQ
jgi:outer membrane protein TolC